MNISEATCRSLIDGWSPGTLQFAVGDASTLRTLMRDVAKISDVWEVEPVSVQYASLLYSATVSACAPSR